MLLGSKNYDNVFQVSKVIRQNVVASFLEAVRDNVNNNNNNNNNTFVERHSAVASEALTSNDVTIT